MGDGLAVQRSRRDHYFEEGLKVRTALEIEFLAHHPRLALLPFIAISNPTLHAPIPGSLRSTFAQTLHSGG